LQAALGVIGFHGGGLLAGETLGRGLGMSGMVRSAWPALQRQRTAFRREDFIQTLWRQRKFPLYSLPSSFLDALCLGLPAPLLIRLYGASLGGYYSLVWRAISLPTILITAAIADTFHSHIAACARQTPHRVMSLFRRTSIGLLVLGAIPAAILWFAGEPLFRLVFGEQWAISGTIAAIVAPWYFSEFVVNPVSRVVFVLSGQKTKLVSDVLALAGLLAVFAVAQVRGMQPLQTIRTLSVVSTALRAIYFLLLVRIVAPFKSVPSAQVQPA